MEFIIHETDNGKVAELISDSVAVRNLQDGLDMIQKFLFSDTNKIIVRKENIVPEFFDLNTRLAGNILQKFVNYHIKLAIVGDFKNITSEPLKAFVYESNRGNEIFFLEDVETAIARLIK
jgi:hypothetical protein